MTLTDGLIIAGFLINTGIVVGIFYGHQKECKLYREMMKSDYDKLYALVINKYGV